MWELFVMRDSDDSPEHGQRVPEGGVVPCAHGGMLYLVQDEAQQARFQLNGSTLYAMHLEPHSRWSGYIGLIGAGACVPGASLLIEYAPDGDHFTQSKRYQIADADAFQARPDAPDARRTPRPSPSPSDGAPSAVDPDAPPGTENALFFPDLRVRTNVPVGDMVESLRSVRQTERDARDAKERAKAAEARAIAAEAEAERLERIGQRVAEAEARADAAEAEAARLRRELDESARRQTELESACEALRREAAGLERALSEAARGADAASDGNAPSGEGVAPD